MMPSVTPNDQMIAATLAKSLLAEETQASVVEKPLLELGAEELGVGEEPDGQ